MISFNETNNRDIYYKIIQMSSKYRDGRSFPIDEVVIADKKINLNAEVSEEMGGFCISDYDHIFRWIIRGDSLCDVRIPEDTKIYKTGSENGIYIADRIILSNPIKLDDNLVMELYINSKLPEISYFRALAACCIKGYVKTAEKVLQEKINESNKTIALQEFEGFCKRREEEYNIDTFSLEIVKNILSKLKKV